MSYNFFINGWITVDPFYLPSFEPINDWNIFVCLQLNLNFETKLLSIAVKDLDFRSLTSRVLGFNSYEKKMYCSKKEDNISKIEVDITGLKDVHIDFSLLKRSLTLAKKLNRLVPILVSTKDEIFYDYVSLLNDFVIKLLNKFHNNKYIRVNEDDK